MKQLQLWREQYYMFKQFCIKRQNRSYSPIEDFDFMCF